MKALATKTSAMSRCGGARHPRSTRAARKGGRPSAGWRHGWPATAIRRPRPSPGQALAIILLAELAAVLPRDADRVPPFLRKTGVIDEQPLLRADSLAQSLPRRRPGSSRCAGRTRQRAK